MMLLPTLMLLVLGNSCTQACRHRGGTSGQRQTGSLAACVLCMVQRAGFEWFYVRETR